MTADALCAKLAAREVVKLAADEWAELALAFTEVVREDTLLSGDIVVAAGPCGHVIVEQPRPDERTVRAAADLAAARAFVAERLATYDRMWNGCGCKVDYFR